MTTRNTERAGALGHLEWTRGLGLALVGLVLLSSCRKVEIVDAGTPSGSPGVALGPPQRVMASPISIRVARGWTAERLDGSETPVPDSPAPKSIDLRETVDVWKATTSSPSGRVDPFIQVSVDRRLPPGTTLSQYLEALRVAQGRQVAGKITHLEAEPVERDGRQGYSLRDAMDVPTGAGGKTPLLQVARVFVDGTAGVTITAMMLEDDKPQLDAAVRAMMDSVRFLRPLSASR